MRKYFDFLKFKLNKMKLKIQFFALIALVVLDYLSYIKPESYKVLNFFEHTFVSAILALLSLFFMCIFLLKDSFRVGFMRILAFANAVACCSLFTRRTLGHGDSAFWWSWPICIGLAFFVVCIFAAISSVESDPN